MLRKLAYPLILHMVFTVPTKAENLEKNNPWPLCSSSFDVPARPLVKDILSPEDALILTDDAELREGGISTLTGNVELTKGEQQVRADRIDYDQAGDSADLHGKVNYWDEALFLSGDTAHLKFEDETGIFNHSQYRIQDTRGRGQARELAFALGETTDLKDADFSTCDPKDNFWKLSASSFHLDHIEEKGKARNVVLRIKDIPVFYTPYISFPLSDKRKSGFLAPSFGSTNQHGFELRTPYYWNIAPNMDATITPRLLTSSGVMLMGEYRYLFNRGEGQVNLEYLPSDSQFNDRHRNLFGFLHEQSFGRTGKLFLTYNRVSDDDYFEDFGTNTSLTSTRYLERRAEASYTGSWWRAWGRVQDFQIVDGSSNPFRRLPQLRFSTRFPQRNKQFNYAFQSEFVYFDRDRAETSFNDSAYRLDLYPSVSFPVRGLSGFIVPKLGLHYTQYAIENPEFNTSPNRTLPIFSLDSGLFFERETKLFDDDYRLTLEPRLYYLYIPETDQSRLPIFDTGVYDFTFSSLFRENRFSNRDRLGDANQITIALTSRLINRDTGRNFGTFRLGQIYYIEDQEVTLPDNLALEQSSSPIVAAFDTEIVKNWNLRSEFQWDPDRGNTEKLIGQIQYDPGNGRLFNLAYRNREDRRRRNSNNFIDIEQTDISFRWPINRQWNVVGRWNYALSQKRSLEIFGGIEYEDCCWGVRAVGRRFLTDINGEFETGFFLQFELKGLAGVGNKTSEFLKKNIPGYQSEF